tara:strand:- start:215 stop:397 length:183 start_codon:yes stop_codon:yes gene_type:complete
MTTAKKGKKGFQLKNTEDKLSKRISAYLTENESKKWNEYLEQNNLKSTEEIRAFILRLID